MADRTVSFVITAPNQEPVTAEVNWEVAQAWMQSLGISTVADAVKYVVTPIIRQGNQVKAEADTEEQISKLG
jgi:hypothetical protein